MKSPRHAIPHVAIEELAEEIWALREEDRNDLDTLLDGSKLDNSRSTFEADEGATTWRGSKATGSF